MKDDQSPKHFNVDQKKIKFLLLATPSLLLISFVVISGFIFYFSKIKLQLISEKPKIIANFENKITVYENRINELTQQNTELKKRLIFAKDVPLKSLEIIKTISGAQDKQRDQLVEVDQLQATLTPKDKLKIDFKLTNQSKNSRVTGYFHLYLSDHDSIHFFPNGKGNMSELSYDQGEYFSTARFRPVSITFDQIKRNLRPKQKLSINIFTLNGDLLYSKTVQLKEIFNER